MSYAVFSTLSAPFTLKSFYLGLSDKALSNPAEKGQIGVKRKSKIVNAEKVSSLLAVIFLTPNCLLANKKPLKTD